ncbi:S8 family serine peptidase [Listeria welshimeri]|uniref:S8 family serine peptidase n=1 Tax=Listeria welshimeri TaxID=1643 RepID=UPI001887A6F9|nr:S8 family serine peptidase [Listeria welshimeri]MBF2464330.1 S8 family serine peptidase [Listeria welshimeri]
MSDINGKIDGNSMVSWGLNRIQNHKNSSLDRNKEVTLNGSDVNVYFVDTGIQYSHPDYAGKAQLGFDVFGGNGEDELGNGTFLSGIVHSIAPLAKLNSVKVVNGEGGGTIEGIIEAIEWITSNAKRPAVVNIAIGIPRNKTLDEKIKESIQSGIIYVIEAGGASEDASFSSPSDLEEGITVGAVDEEDTIAEFSNYGKNLDIFAPGVNILSSKLGEGKVIMSGVQMAAAHVTGVVALLLEKNSKYSQEQIKEKLILDSTEGIIKNVPSGTPNRFLQTTLMR